MGEAPMILETAIKTNQSKIEQGEAWDMYSDSILNIANEIMKHFGVAGTMLDIVDLKGGGV